MKTTCEEDRSYSGLFTFPQKEKKSKLTSLCIFLSSRYKNPASYYWDHSIEQSLKGQQKGKFEKKKEKGVRLGQDLSIQNSSSAQIEHNAISEL